MAAFQLCGLGVELVLRLGKLHFGRLPLRSQLANTRLVLTLAFRKLRLAGFQLILGRLQLGGGLVQPGVGVVALGFELAPLGVELFLGVLPQLVEARLFAASLDPGELLLHVVDERLVVEAARHEVARARHGEISLGYGVVVGEVGVRDVHELLDLPRPQRRGSHGRGGRVVGRMDQANHFVLGKPQRFRRVHLGDLHGVPHRKRAGHYPIGRHHALALVGGKPSLRQHEVVQMHAVPGRHRLVHGLGHLDFERQRMHAHRVRLAADVGHHVGLTGAHDLLDAFDVANRLDVAVAQTHRGHHSQVHQLVGVVERVGGQAHAGRGHAQPGVEADPQRHDGENGEEAPWRPRDRPEHFLVEHASHIQMIKQKRRRSAFSYCSVNLKPSWRRFRWSRPLRASPWPSSSCACNPSGSGRASASA